MKKGGRQHQQKSKTTERGDHTLGRRISYIYTRHRPLNRNAALRLSATGREQSHHLNETHGAMDFGTPCVRTGRRRCLKLAGRTHHIAMSAATMTGAVPMAHGCTVASTVQRASSHSTRMLSSKVTGRAGRRRGYERRGHDGRAQSCAAWAMPRPVERAPASDGADDREKRQSAFRSRPCL